MTNTETSSLVYRTLALALQTMFILHKACDEKASNILTALSHFCKIQTNISKVHIKTEGLLKGFGNIIIKRATKKKEILIDLLQNTGYML